VTQAAQDFETAQRRQHHVEDHQIEGMRFASQPVERLGAIAHDGYLEALAGQILGEHLTELAVIVNDQDGSGQSHGSVHKLG
jgi:hypothetical protein